MRYLTLTLVALILLLQYPLWLGKGSWLRVWKVDAELTEQKAVNKKLQARNNGLDAEVRDLKQGYEAIEERARSELGMVKPDEIFFQVVEPTGATPAPAKNERSCVLHRVVLERIFSCAMRTLQF
jgi:cell division protein FtsB